jgi:hypothetical protein
MTTDALPPEIRFAEVDGVAMGPQTGATGGLGFALRNSAAGSQVPGSLGSFTWSGIWGTYFWVDPAEQLIALQLIQVAPGRGGPFIRAFRNLTYGAFTIPDHGVPASAATPAAIDAAALESYTGTYAFCSISTRDQQAVGPGVLLAREFGGLGIDVSVAGAPVSVASTIRDKAARAGQQHRASDNHAQGAGSADRDIDRPRPDPRGGDGSASRRHGRQASHQGERPPAGARF